MLTAKITFRYTHIYMTQTAITLPRSLCMCGVITLYLCLTKSTGCIIFFKDPVDDMVECVLAITSLSERNINCYLVSIHIFPSL